MKIGSLLAAAITLIGIHLTSGGCSQGPQLFHLEGRVRFDGGEPVTFGRVECVSATSRTLASGEIRRDGSFELGTRKPGDGAVKGLHRVIVLQTVYQGNPKVKHKRHVRMVPPKYGRYETSGLSIEVSETQPNVSVVLTIGD